MTKAQIKKWKIKELRKCKIDPVYFILTYCYIQHPLEGRIKFNLYPFQKEAIAEFEENRFNIILKSRQLGISTLSAAYALWYVMFHDDKTVLIVATKEKVAMNLTKKVTIMYDDLPSWMKSKSLKTNAVEHNKHTLTLGNGSTTTAVACTPEAGRSLAVSLLLIDEAHFIRENMIDEMWSAIYPTLSTGGRAIVLSTPNGQQGWFYKMWVDAEAKLNNFNTIKLHWTVHPDRDQAWRDEQTLILGDAKASQECDVDFLSSGNTVIEPQVLNHYRNNTKDPIEIKGQNEDYWIWKYPEFGRQYIVVGDVARGDAKDFSACHVIDVVTLEQVAEYKGKIGTKEYGQFLVTIATDYNEALLVVENANIGWAVLQEIIDLKYKNTFYTVKELLIADIESYTKKKLDLKNKEDMIPGFTTSSKSRPLIIERVQSYMREKTPIINSVRLINEFDVFVWLKGKAQAQQGYNDDLVMAFAIAIWIRETSLKLTQAGMDLSRSIINSQLNVAIPQSSNNNMQDPYIMNGHDSNTSLDIRWLF